MSTIDDERQERDAPATRVRRGRVVVIPERWRGQTTHPQTIRRRKVEARCDRGNGKGSRKTRQSGYAQLPTRRGQRLAREVEESLDGRADD